MYLNLIKNGSYFGVAREVYNLLLIESFIIHSVDFKHHNRIVPGASDCSKDRQLLFWGQIHPRCPNQEFPGKKEIVQCSGAGVGVGVGGGQQC